MKRAPSPQLISAAGPACWLAYSAPKSQPEPMIDPTLTNIMLVSPTSRRMPYCAAPPCSDPMFLRDLASIVAMPEERSSSGSGFAQDSITSRDRNVDEERRPALTREQADPAAHPQDELAGDVQPEAGAADTARLGGIEAVELLEHAVALGRGDPFSLVADDVPDGKLSPLYPDADATLAVLDGV